MAWQIACFCGLLWEGGPDAACPRCGIHVHQAPPAPTADEWIARMRSEIGDHTTTQPNGEAW